MLLGDGEKMEKVMAEWQPIETAPMGEYAPSILLAHVGYKTITLAGWNPFYEKWQVPSDCEAGDMYDRDFFTHWMPLPEPPLTHREKKGAE